MTEKDRPRKKFKPTETEWDGVFQMNKTEILEWIERELMKAERNEIELYQTELGTYVYQKIYDFIEYNLED